MLWFLLPLLTASFSSAREPGPYQQVERDGPASHPERGFPRAADGAGLFEDVAGSFGMLGRITSTWGAAWSDADGDGRTDLLLGRHAQAPPTLFLNRGDRFVPDDRRITTRIEDRHPPVWGDADSDGDQDLFITTGAGNPGAAGIAAELFLSFGGTAYQEIAEPAGVSHEFCRGRGAAWLDHDGDTDLDLLYLCSESDLGARTAFYRNDGDGFTDIAAQVGLETNLRWNGGIFPADYDDDGDLDLFLTAATRADEDLSVLYRNEGGRYRDVTTAAGLGPLRAARGAAWADFDNDGDLDLFVARGENFRGNGPDGWTSDPARPREAAFHMTVRQDQDPLDVMLLQPSTVDPVLTFDFPEVPIFLKSPPLSAIHIGRDGVHPSSLPFTLGGPGDPDPSGRPQVDPTAEEGIWIWLADTDVPRWFVALTSGGRFLATAGLVRSTSRFDKVRGVFLEPRDLEVPNRLYRNDGDGTFTDVTGAARVAGGRFHNTGPVIAGDFDNDGDQDLFALNGDHVYPKPKPFLAYRNDGGLQFTDVSHALGLPRRALSRKATTVSADFDDDGDLDLWVSNEIGPAPYLYGPYMLLRNRGTGDRGLTLKLIGTASNRDAIGARVRLTSQIRGSRVTQLRQATGGHQLYSQDDPRLHFGLGGGHRVDRLEIRWPSGTVQILEDLDLEGVARLEITEP